MRVKPSHLKIKATRSQEKWFVMEEVPTGINPTLTCSYMNASYIEKLFKDIGIKNTPQKYLTVFKQGGYQLFFPIKNYKTCSQEALQMILKEPNQGIGLNKELLQRSNEFIRFAEKTRKINLNKLSDGELVKSLEQFYHQQTLMHTLGWFGNIVDFVDNAFSNYLLKYLGKQIEFKKSKLKKGEAFSILTTPKEQGFAPKEYISYLKILTKIQKDKRAYKIFKENDARFIFDKLPLKFQKLIKKQAELFGWLGYGVEGPGWQEDYYVDLLASLIRQKASPIALLDKIKLERNQTIKKQKKILKSLDIDLRHRKLFEVARGFVFTKGYRKDAIFHGFWCLEFLHQELVERTYLALKQVRYIYPWEYKKVISEKEKWSSELNKRWEYHIYYSREGKDKVLSEEAGRRFVKKLSFEVKKIFQERRLEGNCASPGKVRGVVAIINTPEENKKIENADILVSAMTNPNLMPAIRKAKAIVTDIGGLTCHAAIVSREFGIPCVVGTKIATQILKDGSVIEVDATHGIVNIIKK